MSNHFIHGAYEITQDFSGHTIAQIELAVAEVMNIEPGVTSVYVDGQRVEDRSNFVVRAGQRIEWIKEEGEKGANFVDVEDFYELYGVSQDEFDWCVKDGMEVLKSIHGPRTIAKLEATHFGRMLMQRRAVADKPPLPGAEFYDNRAFVVKYQEKSCHLGNTIPFRLFKRLAARPGSYVDVETLKDCAWGHDEQIDTNSVHRHFTSLRNKLAKAGVTEFKFDGKTNQRHYALLVQGRHF